MARRPTLTTDLYQRIINSPTFQLENLAYANKLGEPPEDITYQTARLVANTFYRSNGAPKRYDRMNRDPGKPLARYLEKVGLREEGSKHRVGETPRKRRKAA